MTAGGLQHDRPAIHGAMNRPCKCRKESPQLTGIALCACSRHPKNVPAVP